MFFFFNSLLPTPPKNKLKYYFFSLPLQGLNANECKPNTIAFGGQ